MASNSNRARPFHTTYDKNGNLTNDAEGRTFTFDGNNKQIEIRNPGNALVGEYFYDGDGKRVMKVTHGAQMNTTVFVYSGGKLIQEHTTNGPPQDEKIKYLTEDHLGTPRIITDGLGQVVARRDFMPFGEEIDSFIGARSSFAYSSGDDDVRQKFTGYQKDEESGLDFAEARMYENRHGRFTAIDPLLASGKSTNPQTFNRYVYVGDNPVNISDPLGLEWYYNKKKNRYDWLDEKSNTFTWGDTPTTDEEWKDWTEVTGVTGETGSFVYQSTSGNYIALDRHSWESKEFRTLEAALTKGRTWHNSDAKLRGLVKGAEPISRAAMPVLELITPTPLPGMAILVPIIKGAKVVKAGTTIAKGTKVGSQGAELAHRLLPGVSVSNLTAKPLMKHAREYFGLAKGSSPTRQQLELMWTCVQRIYKNTQVIKQGNWRGGVKDALFYSNGNQVIVTKSSGELITVLKNGASSNAKTVNKWYHQATEIWSK